MAEPLTHLSATRMSELVAKGEISSEALVRAHLERIDVLDRSLRAFTEVLRAEALEAARRADAERKAGRVRGPLHGLPVSIKECFDVAGRGTTLGLESRRRHVATDDAALVAALRDAGAVILGRTNLSQTMLFHESRNPVFGQTASPWAQTHTPGGSSGGEGAAIAAGLSPLGLGTDIGGSIRVPACWSGIAGLKPSLDRWPARGIGTVMRGQEGVRSCPGPMARSARDVAFLFGALDGKLLAARDGRVPPLPQADPHCVAVGRLRVGWFTDDGFVRPSHAVARAVERAARALGDQGAEVVPFSPPGLGRAVELYFALLSADGGRTLGAATQGERLDAVLVSMRRLVELSPRARHLLARVLRLMGDREVSRVLAVSGEKTVAELWKLTEEARVYRAALSDAIDRARLDVIVCPAHANPALPHGLSKDYAIAGSGSMLWNLVQFPAGVVPVTRVRSEETSRPGARGRLEKRAAEVDHRSAGLPVGVQVVARPWREDLVLAAMIAIEDAARKDADFPATPVEPR